MYTSYIPPCSSQTVTALWKVRTLTASLCCLWFYSWKAKCFIHHQAAFIKQHINKVKRIEMRSIWGWVTAPDTTESHSILSSGHCCAFDGWLYKVLRDPYSPSLWNFLQATIDRWVAFCEVGKGVLSVCEIRKMVRKICEVANCQPEYKQIVLHPGGEFSGAWMWPVSLTVKWVTWIILDWIAI